MQRAANAYLQTQVTTTSQGEVLILLYDGAITFLNRAKTALAAKDMAEKGLAISRSLDILNELDGSLNLDKGGDLANNLHKLYLFCSNHLIMANIKKDAGRIDEVIRILSGLRGAYAEILTLPEAQAAAQTAAAAMRPTACLQARSQAGMSPSGGSTPAPGANARIRNMHALNGIHAEAGASPSQPAVVKAATVTTAPDSAASVNVAAQTPPTGEPAQTGSVPEGFGKAPFMRKSGTELYRKFAEG
jgi:flagellar protein FliS